MTERRLKGSGLSWIGDVPQRWSVMPTRTVLSIRKDLVGDAWNRTPLLSLTKQGIILRDINSGEGKFPASFATYQVVEVDDLVFCLFDMDETPRTVGRATMAGMVTGAYTRFDVNRAVGDPRFLEWYYLSIDEAKRFRPLYTGLRKVIQKSRFLSAGLAVPTLSEQQQIADYLDRETAQIDTLIEAQQQLVALLLERREATISSAVTRGTETGTPLKQSGLSWVGAVPDHWTVVPTRKVLALAKESVGLEWTSTPLLSLTKHGVIRRDIDGGQGKYPASFETYQTVEVDDLVFCLFDMDETPRTVGRVTSRGMLTGAYTRFRVDLTLADPKFLEWYYIAIDNSKRFRPLYTGLRKVIQKSRFLSAGLALPPLKEQREIAAYLDGQTLRIDALIAEAERFIELSRERRSALITAAVTGQIDVRDEVA